MIGASAYLLAWMVSAGSLLPVQIETMEGRTISGSLSQVDPQGIVVQTEQGDQRLDNRELLRVRPAALVDVPARSQQNPLSVELHDGTRLAAAEITIQRGRAAVELPNGGEVQFSTKALRSVQFKNQDEPLRRQWDAIVSREASADVIVIRKTSRALDETGTERVQSALDHLEGILGEVTATHVAFQFDNAQVEVPREKVEGLLYYRPPGGDDSGSVCQVVTTTGSRWNVRSLETGESGLQLTTASGVRTTIPLDQLAELDYGFANVTYLGDLAPESSNWRPHLSAAGTPPSLARWFQPRRDQAMLGLRGQTCEKGLRLHSRTQLTYRLPGEHQRLRATVGIDDRFRQEGNVRLVITADQTVLLDEEIAGTDDPVELDLPLEGARRLMILVDFGADGTDWGDHLNLCNARLTR